MASWLFLQGMGFGLAVAAPVSPMAVLWWCSLVTCVSAVHHAIGAEARRWIDRVAGAALVVFGVVEVRRAL